VSHPPSTVDRQGTTGNGLRSPQSVGSLCLSTVLNILCPGLRKGRRGAIARLAIAGPLGKLLAGVRRNHQQEGKESSRPNVGILPSQVARDGVSGRFQRGFDAQRPLRLVLLSLGATVGGCQAFRRFHRRRARRPAAAAYRARGGRNPEGTFSRRPNAARRRGPTRPGRGR
jgi:hypothetical protein